MPKIDSFGPYNVNQDSMEQIQMTVEEYESIRLIDYEGLTQDQCAEIMGVARSTVQRIYEMARCKVADSMVNAKIIKIHGGNFKLCEELEDYATCTRCRRRRHRGGRNS